MAFLVEIVRRAEVAYLVWRDEREELKRMGNARG